MTDWFENDALFMAELQQGLSWQEYVAARLRAAGVQDAAAGKLLPRRRLEDQAGRLAQVPDVTAAGEHLEVKSRRLRFTCADDYPYPTALLDTCSGWEAKERKPQAIVLASRITGALLCAPLSSEPLWTRSRQFDSVRGIHTESFACPVEALRPFDALVAWLRRRAATHPEAVS